MSNLSIFSFEGFTVRTGGTHEKPLFVAIDVCTILGIQNASDALSRVPDDWKGVVSSYTLGGIQELLAVTEPGLYELIFASRKESAKRFRRWVFEEVLPTIRKTGSYSADYIYQQTADLILQEIEELFANAPVTATQLVCTVCDRLGLNTNPNTEESLKLFNAATLGANRIGLAFNKHLKFYEQTDSIRTPKEETLTQRQSHRPEENRKAYPYPCDDEDGFTFSQMHQYIQDANGAIHDRCLRRHVKGLGVTKNRNGEFTKKQTAMILDWIKYRDRFSSYQQFLDCRYAQ